MDWIRLVQFSVVFCLFKAVTGDFFKTENCVRNCLQTFIASTGSATFGEGKSLDKISWHEFLELSAQNEHDKDFMQHKFDTICDTYEGLKACLKGCRNKQVQGTVIHGFASLEYICYEKKEEFKEHLPCLANNEYKVMLKCKYETNQTLVATQALQKAAFNDDIDSLKSLLASLCRNTSEIIRCMTPATREACGPKPAHMLQHLVALSFNNIEALYAHMGLQDQLPVSCRRLGELSRTPAPEQSTGGQGETKRSAQTLNYASSFDTQKFSLVFLPIFAVYQQFYQ